MITSEMIKKKYTEYQSNQQKIADLYVQRVVDAFLALMEKAAESGSHSVALYDLKNCASNLGLNETNLNDCLDYNTKKIINELKKLGFIFDINLRIKFENL